MDQATATTPPTASTTPDEQLVRRAAFERATALAARLVDRLTVLPSAIETASDYGRSTYGVRLHCGLGLAASRTVLEVAAIAGTDVTREEAASGTGEWIECRATIDGVPLIARALVDADDAAELRIPRTRFTRTRPADTDTAEPVPLGESVVAQVPAVTLVEAAGGAQ